MWKATLKGIMGHKLRLALTAMSVVLGVAFVSGTFILGDTLHHTFDQLFGTVYSRVDLNVRAKSAFSANGQAQRNPVDAGLLDRVRPVPGVTAAQGNIFGYAQLVAPNGKAISPQGPPTIGLSVGPVARLSPLELSAGRRPVRDGEVVVDSHSADTHGFKVGQRISVLFQGPTEQFTVVGIVKFGNAASLAGATLTGFDTTTAQRVLNRPGQFDSIDVLVDHGRDRAAVARDLQRVLPPGLEVVTGQTLANENTSSINQGLGIFTTALLVFALVSLFVGAFIIFNTFNILVSQRTRELGLLRALGAGRGQVLGSVVLEALVVGAFASGVGLALGMGFAKLLEVVLTAFGVDLPTSGLVFKPHTAVAGIVVGVGVTLLSAINPARRASKVAPMEALREAPPQPTSLRGRAIAGGIVLALGLAAVAGGLTGAGISLVGLGALLGFVGAAILAPLVARPMAGAIGAPLARLLGTPGSLGRENAMRSPRRTASTASALMVGLALVTTFTVFGASLTTSATSVIDKAISADYVVATSGFAPFSAAVADEVRHQPGVRSASPVLEGPFQLDGTSAQLQAVSPAAFRDLLILRLEQGSTAALDQGQLLIDTTTASKRNLHLGQQVPATFARTGAARLTVGGIYKPNQLLGSYLVSDNFFAQHFTDALPIVVLVRTDAGAGAKGKAALATALAAHPNLVVRTQAEFKAFQRKQVNQLLGIIYVLLGLAVIIALMGIVNTLVLSVLERTRELGLLRAVGMQRRQVRTMIRAESVIVAVFGSLLGLLIGIAFGLAIARAMKDQGVTDLVVPFGTLAVFLLLAAVAGLAAASWPARKAARLDVLRAIATT